MAYVEITFSDTGNELNDLLIARLTAIDYDGFEEERRQLKAYIRADQFDKEQLEEVCAGLGIDYIVSEIPETNWNALWESNFEAVRVGNFCGVRADFHEAYTDVQYEIVITPKMSFGTGHHPTTFMMIEQMQDLDMKNKTVFDFGTGTGVLAILAKKMGAANVVAIDNDDWSITNALENMTNNTVAFDLTKAETLTEGLQFDVVLANITRNVITENFHALVAALKHGSILLLSGLLHDDEEHILKLAATHPLTLRKKLERKSWISLAFERN